MLRPIVLYPDPRLKLKSKPVTQFGPELRELAADMTETMRHSQWRWAWPPSRSGKTSVSWSWTSITTLRTRENPRPFAILRFSKRKEAETGIEEKLMPFHPHDVREEVERSLKVKVKYRDLEGHEKVTEFEGLLARCVLHEILDHMNGQLFIQKGSRRSSACFSRLTTRPAQEEFPRNRPPLTEC